MMYNTNLISRGLVAMYHQVKLISPKEKPHDLGTVKAYRFKKITSMGLSLHVLACGEENISESKSDRLLIVKDGFASVLGTGVILRDGDVYEVPAGASIVIHGQLKYYLITQHA